MIKNTTIATLASVLPVWIAAFAGMTKLLALKAKAASCKDLYLSKAI